MSKVERLDVMLTVGARSRLLGFVNSVPDSEAILAFLKWRKDEDDDEHWGYGTYSARKVAAIAAEVEQRGHTLLFDIDGITVAIPQFHLLSELEEKLIDEANGRLVIREL